jgi:hypothetical protein
VAKSRFAFGGKPVESSGSGITHWTGTDGELGIFSSGYKRAVISRTRSRLPSAIARCA